MTYRVMKDGLYYADAQNGVWCENEDRAMIWLNPLNAATVAIPLAACVVDSTGNIVLSPGQAPCKDCAERSATCHASCAAYAVYVHANAQHREKVYRERTKHDDVDRGIIDIKAKVKRGHGR